MQDLESQTKSSGRVVISLRGELRYFSQCNRGKKQQEKPYRATDVPAGIGPEKPANPGDRQHGKRGDTPAVIRRAGPPPTSQDEQRRNDGKKKKDVIEIQGEMWSFSLIRYSFEALTTDWVVVILSGAKNL